MNLKKLSLVLALLMLSTPASSQDTSWDMRFETAMSKEVPSQKIDALLELSRSEPDFQNRIVAGYNAMAIAYEVQRYETAADIGERLLELTDKHAKGNLKQRDAIADYLLSAYFRNDQPREARRVIDENLNFNDEALSDLWASTDRSIVHRFTSMVCPNQVGDLYRESTRVYDPTGIDVGCDYKAYSGEDNSVSVYFSKYDLRDTSPKKAHDDLMETVKINWRSADLIIDNETSDFTTPSGGIVRESLFRLGSIQKGYRYTGTWTNIIDSWVLKSRITWDGALGEDFGHKHAKALLSETSKNIKPHLDFCNVKHPEKEAERLDVQSAQALASLLTIVSSGMEGKSESRPLKSCMGESSQEGNAIIEWYENSDRLYSIIGSSVDNDVYVAYGNLQDLLNKTEANQYHLKSIKPASEKGETLTEILAVYSGRPSQSQVFRDYVAYRKGELSSLGSVLRQKNGDSQVNVNIASVSE